MSGAEGFLYMKKAADKKMKKRIRGILLAVLLVFLFQLPGCQEQTPEAVQTEKDSTVLSEEEIPEFEGESYVVLNDNQPEFEEEDFTEESYEHYSELDALGRCQTAEANIGPDLMPDEERKSIGQIKPSGWHTVKYDCVEGKYLYNRCHLIGYQLTAENANEKNLITGTRYMNTEGMLPFENMVAEYIRETDNHVLYRVTPVYEGDNLVASGVQMEAESVEDHGEGICFNIYAYNSQPDIEIDYETGASWEEESEEKSSEGVYILNTNSHKFHLPDCSGAADIKEKNREEYEGSRKWLLRHGYEPCKRCNP